MADNAALPLAGLKVLELGHIVAGPAAGQILADMGADVIKVESVDGGDQVRQMPGSMAAMFQLLNRNKRSVALDLKGEGAEIFLKMASGADVVIENFSYGAVDRLGLGYEVVSQTNPGLVWLSIKGFLPGPSESQPLLDELAQMAGGLAFMTGTETKPVRAGASIIDLGAAAYGIIAVLAALRQRDTTGKGQHIVAGLYETSVYYVAQWMATAQFSGEQSVPMATAYSSASCRTRTGAVSARRLVPTCSWMMIAFQARPGVWQIAQTSTWPSAPSSHDIPGTKPRVCSRSPAYRLRRFAGRTNCVTKSTSEHRGNCWRHPFPMVRRVSFPNCQFVPAVSI